MVSSIFILVSATLIAVSTASDCPGDGCQFPVKYRRAARPIESNYTETGTTFVLNNMTIYETINKTPKRVLIAAHDLFGLSNNLKQVVDKLAEGFGFKIVLPDYYRGAEWNQSNYPPENPQDLLDWLDIHGSWDLTARDDTEAIINHFKTVENVTDIGIFGFCWGGKTSVQAGTEFPELKAAGVVHPTNVSNDEAEGVQIPTYLLPSRGEPNMLPFYMVLQRKFGTNCGHRRFDDMAHAFAGSGGDFSNPLVALRVNEVIDILGNFFDKNLH